MRGKCLQKIFKEKKIMKRNNKKGFTITELVIVIAVIAILAAVLIPTFSGVIKKAKLSNDTQVAANLTKEIDWYCVEYNIDKDNLLGTDVRTLAESFNYDLIPATEEWTFVWDKNEHVVTIVQKKEDSELFNATVNQSVPTDPAHVYDKYFLLGRGNSALEKAVELLCNLSDVDQYAEAMALLAGTEFDQAGRDVIDVLSSFNPDTTMYLTSSNHYTNADMQDVNGSAVNVVYTEGTYHLASPVKGSIARSIAPRASQVIRSIEVGEYGIVDKLANLYKKNNVKKMDLSTAEGVADAGLQPLNVEEMFRVGEKTITNADGTTEVVPEYRFTFGNEVVESTRQEIIFEGTSVIVKYYNETGLFAYGKMDH